MVRTEVGDLIPCTVLVDSGSSVNLATERFLSNVHALGEPLSVSALTDVCTATSGGTAHLMVDQENGDSPLPFPVECVALAKIGPAYLDIDILLSAASGAQLGYIAAQPTSLGTPREHLPALRMLKQDSRAASRRGGVRRRGPRRPKPAPPSPWSLSDQHSAGHLCALAEAKVASVLNTKRFPMAGDHPYSKADIKWGKEGRDHSPGQRRQFERLIDEFHDVFCTEAFPPPCACPPVDVPLKDPNARIPFEHRGQWRPHEKNFLARVRAQLESFDIIEKCPQPAGSSRVTLAAKGEFDIRTCIDLRRVNALLKPFRHYYKNGPDQVSRASNSKHKFRSSFDLASAYSQLTVNEESRRLLGVTLPDESGNATVYTYKRLPFGLASSGAYLAKFLEEAFADLPHDMLEDAFFYYMDDIVITSATFEDHTRHVRAFFEVCRKSKLRISYKKAQALCSEVTFYGFVCSADGTSLSDDNTAALRTMPYPTNVSECRHVIGVFSVARAFVTHFAHHIEPLARLVRKNVPWHFGAAEQEAFEHIRDALLRRMRLHAFNADWPLVLHTDASGIAEAAWLAQKRPDGELVTIAFYSKGFSERMRRQGATAREAHAVIYGLHAARVYCHSSPFPTTVFTDCRSLTFVKDSSRSELSVRFLQHLQDHRYVIRYKRGSENQVADAFSRIPMLGHDLPTRAGTAIALDDLLEHLAGTSAHLARRVWVYMAEHNEEAYRSVQLWRGKHNLRNKMCSSAPSPELFRSVHDLRILRFDPHDAVERARQALLQPCPTAILLPLDLAGNLGVDENGNTIPSVRNAVLRAHMRAYVGSNNLWVLHNIAEAENDVCLVADTLPEPGASTSSPGGPPPGPRRAISITDASEDPLPDGAFREYEHYGETRHLLDRLGQSLDLSSWPESQDVDEVPAGLRPKVVSDDRGLKWLRVDNGPDQVIVPRQFRSLLARLVHTETNHAKASTLAREILRSYYWPGIHKFCADFVKRCEKCAVGNVRRVRHHNIYAASNYTTPRQVIGLDVKKIAVGSEVRYLLLIIDKFSSFCTMAVMPDRTAASVIQALDEEFFSIFGPAQRVTIDGAQEFKSRKLHDWLRARGSTIVTPMEFYAQAAGHVERVWVMVRAALRRTLDFTAWRAELRQAVFQYNALCRDTGTSPYELFFGGIAPSTASTLAAAVRAFDDPAVHDARDVEIALADGAAAIRTQAAADANLARRVRAVDLNKSGRSPPEFKVGDKVWFWQEVSGGVSRTRGRDRPRTALSPWLKGVVSAIHGPRLSVTPARSGPRRRGQRTLHERHRSCVKHRTDASPPDPGDAPVSDTVSAGGGVGDGAQVVS